jgi:hypothetical protein
MKSEVVLAELEAAAQQLGIRISYEPLQMKGLPSSHGGLCRVKGTYRIIVDKRATTEERVATVAMALARLDNLAVELSNKGVELSDKVREVLRTYEPSSRHRLTAA